MIVIYTSPGCASCRKVRKFLKDNGHEFIDKNIFTTLLNEKEIKYLLSRTENGSDDLISRRSKIIQNNNIDIDSMSTSELINFIKNNPSVLRRPIIIDVNNFQVGYDEEEIEIFNKVKELAKCDKSCSHYETCGKLRREFE
ncbi:MAG: transcriptional regulator Spx [Firmicutes bacterium]|nr:transcriptional regulator Spx [Candidatus Colivicinus equi]